MALLTSLSLISLDKSGRVLTISNSTGAYSVDNPGGFGSPNPASILKIIFEVARLNSITKSTVTQSLAVVNAELPTQVNIIAGNDIVLNSKILGITSSLEGLEAFSDGVLEVVSYTVVDAAKLVTGVVGDLFVTGTGLSAYSSYDHILVGADLYQINHSLGTNGGTVLYLETALKTAVTSFYPVDTASLKVLVDKGADSFISHNIGEMAKEACSCPPLLSKIHLLSKIFMWKLAAKEAFDTFDYHGADKLLQNITDYSRKGCSC